MRGQEPSRPARIRLERRPSYILPVHSMKRLRNSGPGVRHSSRRPKTRYRLRATASYGGIQDRVWEDAHHDCRPPGPPELAGDEQRGAAPAEYPGVTRLVVRDHVERGQFVRVASATCDHRSSGCALERREGENAAVVVLQKELDQTAAKPADSVVEQEVSAVGPSGRLRRRTGHDVILVNMFTENVKPRTRGRPPGQTAQGAAARDRLYATAWS